MSYTSIQSGLILAACDSVKKILKTIPRHARVGVMTYDKHLTFFTVAGETPKMIVVSDLDDVFVPVGEGFLWPMSQGTTVLEEALSLIPQLHKETKTAESCLGSALSGAFEALKVMGGKVVAFSSTMCVTGPGALKMREDVKLLGTDKEMTLYEPADFFWKKLGENYVTAGVSCDMVLAGNGYFDVSTCGVVSAMSGGEMFYYPGFAIERDGVRVVEDIVKLIDREWGYDALLRVRCSTGSFSLFRLPSAGKAQKLTLLG